MVGGKTSGRTTAPSRRSRPGKRRRASAQARGSPTSSVNAVAETETWTESQTGRRSMSEFTREQEPEALHDGASLRTVQELDERHAQLRAGAPLHDRRHLVERPVELRIDGHVPHLG